MKLKYEKPEIDVTNIQPIDVIYTSGDGLIITPSGGTGSGTWDSIDGFGGMY